MIKSDRIFDDRLVKIALWRFEEDRRKMQRNCVWGGGIREIL